MVQDAIRMLCNQVTIQAMMSLSSGSGSDAVPFFSSDFLLLVVYVILGVMLYWLAVRKLVVVV